MSTHMRKIVIDDRRSTIDASIAVDIIVRRSICRNVEFDRSVRKTVISTAFSLSLTTGCGAVSHSRDDESQRTAAATYLPVIKSSIFAFSTYYWFLARNERDTLFRALVPMYSRISRCYVLPSKRNSDICISYGNKNA